MTHITLNQMKYKTVVEFSLYRFLNEKQQRSLNLHAYNIHPVFETHLSSGVTAALHARIAWLNEAA
jgi:hypothetical protein